MHQPKTLMLILLKTFLHRRRDVVKKLTSGIAMEAGVSITQSSWHIYILPTELKAISSFFLKRNLQTWNNYLCHQISTLLKFLHYSLPY